MTNKEKRRRIQLTKRTREELIGMIALARGAVNPALRRRPKAKLISTVISFERHRLNGRK